MKRKRLYKTISFIAIVTIAFSAMMSISQPSLAVKDWDPRSKLSKERAKEHLQKIGSLQNMKDYCDSLYDWKMIMHSKDYSP